MLVIHLTALITIVGFLLCIRRIDSISAFLKRRWFIAVFCAAFLLRCIAAYFCSLLCRLGKTCLRKRTFRILFFRRLYGLSPRLYLCAVGNRRYFFPVQNTVFVRRLPASFKAAGNFLRYGNRSSCIPHYPESDG